jgi:COMPASS component SPP1
MGGPYLPLFPQTLWGVKDQRGYRAKLYCVCQKPYTGEFIIRCDECKEWYHGDCVRITQEEAKAMGDFQCTNYLF